MSEPRAFRPAGGLAVPSPLIHRIEMRASLTNRIGSQCASIERLIDRGVEQGTFSLGPPLYNAWLPFSPDSHSSSALSHSPKSAAS